MREKNNRNIKPHLNYLTGMLVEILAILFFTLISFIIMGFIASWYK